MKIRYSSKGIQLTEDLEKYAGNKAAYLNRKVPYRLRSDADCLITFAQTTSKSAKQSTCRVVLTIQDTKLSASETTQHMYAALDIAMVQIEQQLKSYLRVRRRSLVRRRGIKGPDD